MRLSLARAEECCADAPIGQRFSIDFRSSLQVRRTSHHNCPHNDDPASAPCLFAEPPEAVAAADLVDEAILTLLLAEVRTALELQFAKANLSLGRGGAQSFGPPAQVFGTKHIWCSFPELS